MIVFHLSSGLLLSAMYLNTLTCLPIDDGGQASVAANSHSHNALCQAGESWPTELDDSRQTESPSNINVEWRVDSQPKASFWDNWAREFDSPFLTSSVSSSFYGLGVWMPDKFADDDLLDVEEIKELIKKYGLQMSFGIGGKDGQSPRLRFDYRWHEDRNLDDVFIQVEIPFQ